MHLNEALWAVDIAVRRLDSAVNVHVSVPPPCSLVPSDSECSEIRPAVNDIRHLRCGGHSTPLLGVEHGLVGRAGQLGQLAPDAGDRFLAERDPVRLPRVVKRACQCRVPPVLEDLAEAGWPGARPDERRRRGSWRIVEGALEYDGGGVQAGVSMRDTSTEDRELTTGKWGRQRYKEGAVRKTECQREGRTERGG